VRSGKELNGVVVFANTGTTSVQIDTVRPIDVKLVVPATHEVVGIYGGPVAGTGYSPLLSPGQSQAVPIDGGTARCDGGVGSAVPPGRYDAVGFFSGPTVTGSEPNSLTNFVPVRVVSAK
jgi:hypothetical protein